METCVRGFSYIPASNLSMKNLQYVENSELERTWKTSRRQRLKQQEDKVWDEFVKEKDIVASLSKDDPYQFLNQLPESCLKELLDEELQKMKQDMMEEDNGKSQQWDIPSAEPEVAPQMVTFAEDDNCAVFHVFDDKDDDALPEAEGLNESPDSPVTVRERSEPELQGAMSSEPSALDIDKVSGKSSENVSNVVESSIYCAKVKELRIKIMEQLLDILDVVEVQDLRNLDAVELKKMQKRCTEFCARFSRLRTYQLQRQVQDIGRHGAAPAFGKHTHCQAQLARIISLHQNTLHALQVFAKSSDTFPWLSESVTSLRALMQVCRDAGNVSPGDCAKDLFEDEMEPTCDKLETALESYSVTLTNAISALESTDAPSTTRSKTSKGKVKKRSMPSKSGSQCSTDARFSMYSLNPLSANTQRKSTKDSVYSTYKKRGKEEKQQEPKSQKKRSRRPLMRDPNEGNPRARRLAHEQDIQTLVESVRPCASSHVSIASPQTPKQKNNNSHRSKNSTPRNLPQVSPKNKPRLTPKMNSPRNVAKKAVAGQELELTADGSRAKSVTLKDLEKELKADMIKKEENKTNLQVLSNMVESQRQRTALIEVKEKDKTVSPYSAKKNEKDKNRAIGAASHPEEQAATCDMSAILKILCGGDEPGEHVTGAPNAQLQCVSARPADTAQLLRILEDTIQKKAPKPRYFQKPSPPSTDQLRLTFNIGTSTADALFQYRTQFVQHMLASSMYANCALSKPWEMVENVSDQIIDELLVECAKEMQLQKTVQKLYRLETN